jgi:hypothetical protein
MSLRCREQLDGAACSVRDLVTLTAALFRASLRWGEQAPPEERFLRVGGRYPLMSDAYVAKTLPDWTTSTLTPELGAIMVDVLAAHVEDPFGCDHARQTRELTLSPAGSLA